MRYIFRGILLVCFMIGIGAWHPSSAQQSWQSKFIHIENGVLKAVPDEKGDIIPDFNKVGYRKGEVTIPEIRIVRTISAPVSGDAQMLIQKAIDEVSHMKADDRGFRGAILLKKGIYEVPGSITISTEGIVLRGEGPDQSGTVLVASGKGQRSLVIIAGKKGASEIAGRKVPIADPYVPVGCFTFMIEDGRGFTKGDEITICRPGTEKWIHDLRMDQIVEREGTRQWKAEGYDLKFEREIVRIEGNRIWIDQPVVMAMETQYGGGFIVKNRDERISNAGVENILFTSDYISEEDEDHGWYAVEFQNCRDGWVRNIVSKYFGKGCVLMTQSSKYITVTDSKCLEAKSIITGGRRYSFNIEGQMCLVMNCETTDGRHDFVTGSRVRGPNVFYNCTARNTQNDIGPHHRWSVGTLYDNITTDGEINVQDRGNYGSGHGWAGANQLLWNCRVKKAAVQNPWVSAKNWCIGLSGDKSPGRFNDRPDGEWEGLNRPGLQPSSLYRAQVDAAVHAKTIVTIKGDDFFINGEITLKGRTLDGISLEGLLPNSRMVQGIFDDLNPETRHLWKYPDTGEWNADRNTDEFVAAMPEWRRHGLLAFTLNIQGGSPTGYGNKGWMNPGYYRNGILREEYIKRLERILTKADELGMVVILGLFYFGQDEYLQDEAAVINAVNNTVDWMFERKYRNVLIEINNECNSKSYEHPILKPERVHELIELVRTKKHPTLGYRYCVSTSFTGRCIPLPNVLKAADFVLLHGNGANDPGIITAMVDSVRRADGYRPMPILFNEDDHYDFDRPVNNMTAAFKAGTSWGYFDFRKRGETLKKGDSTFAEGYQSIPVDWRISSPRKKDFFESLAVISGINLIDSVALDNPYVRVVRNSAVCGLANTPQYGTRIIVALTGVRIQSSKGVLNLQRGGIAVFAKQESYQPPTGEYFEVALKTNHPAVKGPEEWIEPQKNTIVYEDEQIRVFEERLEPGSDRELHSHAQRIVVRLNEVQLTDPRFHPNGTPGGGIQVPNTVRFAEPIVHVVHNLSKTTPLFNIVIELKAQH
ncbi:MAG: hypothetical protein NTV54_15625 [Ignavibacteriales bacterium]|nr:hypothetical protein [Ignavibacteriales bacterium]